MEKNSLKYTGLLAFIVWGALLLMHLLPSITMGGRVLRRVDILGEVRRPSKPVSEPDSLLPPPPKVKPAFVDTCRAGMTCIEDYSDSTMRGMTRFYQALDELAKAPRPVLCLFRRLLYRSGYSDGRFARDASAEIWRLRSGFCHHHVHDQWFPSYSASFLQRMAEPFCHGLRVL